MQLGPIVFNDCSLCVCVHMYGFPYNVLGLLHNFLVCLGAIPFSSQSSQCLPTIYCLGSSRIYALCHHIILSTMDIAGHCSMDYA